MDFTSAGLDFDDSVTVNRGCANSSTANTAEPVLRVQDTLLHNNGADANGVIGSAAGADELRDALAGGTIDALTFTSPTTVDNVLRHLAPEELSRLKARSRFVSIGPTTTAALQASASMTSSRPDNRVSKASSPQ